MNNNVVHPNHYNKYTMETIEVIKGSSTDDEYRGFLKGNIIKYVSRYRFKNGIEDIKKALYYLEVLEKFESELLKTKETAETSCENIKYSKIYESCKGFDCEECGNFVKNNDCDSYACEQIFSCDKEKDSKCFKEDKHSTVKQESCEPSSIEYEPIGLICKMITCEICSNNLIKDFNMEQESLPENNSCEMQICKKYFKCNNDKSDICLSKPKVKLEEEEKTVEETKKKSEKPIISCEKVKYFPLAESCDNMECCKDCRTFLKKQLGLSDYLLANVEICGIGFCENIYECKLKKGVQCLLNDGGSVDYLVIKEALRKEEEKYNVK